MLLDYLAGACDAAAMRWRFAHASPEQLARHRLTRLRRLCTLLAQRSTFFREYFSGVDPRRMSFPEFDALPLLDKSVMMERFDQWNTAGLSREGLLGFARENDRNRSYTRWYRGTYSVGLSSGTSGMSGLSVYSRSEVAQSVLRFLVRTGLPRGLSGHRILFALRTSAVGFGEINRFGWLLRHVDYRQPLTEVVRLINTLRLNIVAGSPTYLTELAAVASGIDHPLEGVVSYAEILEAETKAALQKAFGAPVCQIYAGTEGYIAATCPGGTLHLNDDLLHIRLVPCTNGPVQRCHLVISDVNRVVQPIINYRLNDLVELDPSPCACGSAFRVVRGILGRADDALLLCGAGGRSSLLYPDYVRRAIQAVGADVKEYRVVQRARDRVDVLLEILPAGDQGAAVIRVRTALTELLAAHGAGPVAISVETGEIPLDPDRKLKRVERISGLEDGQSEPRRGDCS